MNLKHRYALNIERKKVGVVGAMPPLLGGVSIHNERVVDLLHTNHNRVSVFDPDARPALPFIVKPFYKAWRAWLLMWWLFWNRHDYVFYHATYKRDCLLDIFIVGWCSKKIYIIEHNCRHMYKRAAYFKRLYSRFLKRVATVVFIGNSTKKSYDDTQIIYDNYSVESAFLPPTSTQLLITKAYNSSLHIFLQDHTPILLINSAHIMVVDGVDIYGLEDTLYAMHALKERYPDVGLIMAIAHIGNQKYWEKLEKLMHDLHVAENIYVLHNNQYIWPLFAQIDLFLRPTYSDGESISVQEALHFKVPVLASDVVERPDTVWLFKTGDRKSYSMQAEKILKERVYAANNKRDYLYAQ